MELSKLGLTVPLSLFRDCIVTQIAVESDRVELTFDFDFYREERTDGAEESEYAGFKSCVMSVVISEEGNVFASIESMLSKKGVSKSLSFMRINDFDNLGDFAEMVNSGAFILSVHDIFIGADSVNLVFSAYPQIKKYKKYASATMLVNAAEIRCVWSE